MIRRFLKFKLGLSYKIIRPISYNHNSIMNKLKRQFAAAKFIHLMH